MMTPEEQAELQRIIDSHADWLDTLLTLTHQPNFDRAFVIWLFRVAFIHGAKHVVELREKREAPR